MIGRQKCSDLAVYIFSLKNMEFYNKDLFFLSGRILVEGSYIRHYFHVHWTWTLNINKIISVSIFFFLFLFFLCDCLFFLLLVSSFSFFFHVTNFIQEGILEHIVPGLDHSPEKHRPDCHNPKCWNPKKSLSCNFQNYNLECWNLDSWNFQSLSSQREIKKRLFRRGRNQILEKVVGHDTATRKTVQRCIICLHQHSFQLAKL